MLALASIPGHADVLSFNDLPASAGGTHMPDTYGGFSWASTNWHHMTSASAPSDPFLALSGTATIVTVVSGGQDFYFDGAEFWSRRGLDANGDFYFVLYHDGATVYNGRVESGGRQRFDSTHTLLVPDYAGPIDGFALAFDSGPDHWNHIAMDNIRVRAIACNPACPADTDCSGTLTVQDLFGFLTNYFASAPSADINRSGDLSIQDIFDFLAAYFAGCN